MALPGLLSAAGNRWRWLLHEIFTVLALEPRHRSGYLDGEEQAQLKGVVMRKMMLALTAAGMLAVPTGLVVAQESGAEPIDPESTVLVAEQDRDQVRDRDGTCDLDGDMLQSRDRAQAHVGESSDHGAQARQRAQAEVEDGAKQASPDAECDGDQLRIQEHARIRDAADA